MSQKYEPSGPIGRFVNTLEESFIALLLGAMTLITFANVVLRYGFNSQLIWGLELTLILFAWLVLFGVSYCVKVTAHLGVDAVITLFSPGKQKFFAIISALVCITFALILLKGAWDFWAPFGNFAPTTGRVIPTGFEEMKPHHFQGYYPTDQVPLPEIFRAPLESWLLFEEDLPFEKMPRAIPYIILPFSMALLTFRFIQAGIAIVKGTQDRLIVSHEAEEAVAEAAAANKEG